MSQTLKILTWNIWNYNKWEERKQYLAESIRAIDADIIALQEVRYNYLQGLNQAEELSQELPGYSLIVQPAAVQTHHWEGLAIFSKHSISRVNYWGLSRDEKDLEDAPHQRIVLAAEIGWKDTPLCIFNSHWSLSKAARLRTAGEVLGFIKLFAGKNEKIILLGDFNAEPSEESIQLIKQDRLGLMDSWEKQHGSTGGGTCKVPTLKRRLDYIFYGKGLLLLSCKRVGLKPNGSGVYPSDHTGLVANFQVSY